MRLRPGAVRHVEDLGSIGSAARDANAEAGWQAYQRGDLESARTSLAAAAGASGAHPWVHYALGQANYGLRQYRDAVTEWQKVLAAAPEFEPVYFDLVDGCLQLKDYDLAMRTIRTATTRWPKDAEVFNALGVVQVARGALDDAIKSFGEAIATAPKDGVGYYNLARAHDLRYVRSRRYVTTTRTWFESKPDKDAAIENYNRYLSIGGPFEKSAREALTRLGWTASPQ
ncbi:MAG TPA: tetratricopeptide repeat protein [Vicinamibacterales bacterium]|nr:tetratricopeptide repeat protein [Vicinamibacterales bacterium]